MDPNMDIGESPILQYQVDPKSRVYFVFFRFAGIGLVTLIGTLIVLQEVLLPNWAPPARFNLAAALAVVVAFAATAFLFCRWIYAADVFSDRIVFKRQFGSIEIPFAQLEAVMGARGVDLSGGEIFPWKHTVFLGQRASAKLSILDEEQNEELLTTVCNISKDTLGVSLPRKLTLNVHAYADATDEMRSWYVRSALKSITLGLAGLLVLAAIFVAFFVFAPKDEIDPAAVAQVGMYAIVAVVICIGIAFLGVCDLFSLRRLLKTLDRSRESGSSFQS